MFNWSTLAQKKAGSELRKLRASGLCHRHHHLASLLCSLRSEPDHLHAAFLALPGFHTLTLLGRGPELTPNLVLCSAQLCCLQFLLHEFYVLRSPPFWLDQSDLTSHPHCKFICLSFLPVCIWSLLIAIVTHVTSIQILPAALHTRLGIRGKQT